MEGPDHKASVTPNELKQLVLDIRRVAIHLNLFFQMELRAKLFFSFYNIVSIPLSVS